MKNIYTLKRKLQDQFNDRKLAYEQIQVNSEIFSPIKHIFTRLVENGSIDNIRIHPLGFCRYTIISREGKEKLPVYLNFWQEDSYGNSKEDVHNHCYDFTSVCLSGEITHEIYEKSNDNKGIKLSLLNYQSGGSVDSSSINNEHNSILTLVDSKIVKKGDGYYMNNNCLHSISKWKRGTITAQFQSDFYRNHADVYRDFETIQYGNTRPANKQLLLDNLYNLLCQA